MASHRIRGYPVILDTNAFFLPFQFGINLDSELSRVTGEYRLLTTRSVWRELQMLASRKEKHSREAILLFDHLSPEVVDLDGSADDDLISLAKDVGGAILTQDSELRHRALRNGVPVILLRAGKHLIFQRPAGA